MEKRIDRVIFTCGGTAGHVNPAIAVAQLMAEQNPDVKILFVGAERGLEKDLIPKAGYDFRTVHISSFHRSFKPAEIRHNLVSLFNMVRSPAEARAILRAFRPDVVIGTGGYASYPTVKAAAKMGIPTAVHESNAVPGLTTELLEPYAGRIYVTTDDGSQGIKGFAVDALPQIFADQPIDRVSVCGPTVMMKTIAQASAKAGIACEVSMEKRMACGIGVCLGCTFESQLDGKRYKVCADGPVFDAKEVFA